MSFCCQRRGGSPRRGPRDCSSPRGARIAGGVPGLAAAGPHRVSLTPLLREARASGPAHWLSHLLAFLTAREMAAQCVTKVQLNISCDNLLDKDIGSKSDPLCVLFLNTSGQQWYEVILNTSGEKLF